VCLHTHTHILIRAHKQQAEHIKAEKAQSAAAAAAGGAAAAGIFS